MGLSRLIRFMRIMRVMGLEEVRLYRSNRLRLELANGIRRDLGAKDDFSTDTGNLDSELQA